MTRHRRILLLPLLAAGRQRFFPGRLPLRTVAVAAACLLAMAGIHAVSLKVLTYFHAQNELGIILSLKLLAMLWIIMFTMHFFSCMVSAVAEVFLTLDNEIVFTAPVPLRSIFWMRYLTTYLRTSWMSLLFSLPVYAAFGQVFAAGPLYWPLLALTLPTVAGCAVGAALVLTIVLVRLFPARRTRDIIVYLSLLMAVAFYLIFRMIRPELLADPNQFATFIDYLSAVSAPSGPFVPGAWAADLLSTYLMERRVDLLLTGLLLTTPAALFFCGEWAMTTLFFQGYDKSQESFGGHRRFGRGFARRAATSPLRKRPEGIIKLLAQRHLKTLLRDSNEWSQLMMVAALIVVYLYNFTVLPLDSSFWAQETLANLIAFLNIGLSGFVATALAARFVLPSIGAEGGGFDIIRTSPLGCGRYLRCSFAIHLPPFLLLTVFLAVMAARLLGVNGPMLAISIFCAAQISAVAVALALCFGAIFADFKAASATAAQGGVAALIFLLAVLVYEGILLGSGAYPAYRLTRAALAGRTPTPEEMTMMLTWALGGLLVTLAVIVMGLRRGAAHLENNG